MALGSEAEILAESPVYSQGYVKEIMICDGRYKYIHSLGDAHKFYDPVKPRRKNRIFAVGLNMRKRSEGKFFMR